nr:histone deacetylase 14 [Tanacetum cinerariifolium]
KMADVNAPSGQALEIVPPVRTDDQILPRIKWVPNGPSQLPPPFHQSTSSSSGIEYNMTRKLETTGRELLTIINLCLTGKTSGFERPRAHVLQILWGIMKQANIDYAERSWEEFVQSIHTFIEDKRNLSQHTTGKKRATLIVIPSIRFTKLIIHQLQRRHKFHPRPNSPLHLPNEEPVLGYLKFSAKGTKREVFVMPIPGSLITADIQEASYYREYLAKVAQHRRYLAGETGGVQDQPEKKRKQATETSDKPPKAKKSKYGWVSKKRTLKNAEASKAEEVPAMEPQSDSEEESKKVVLGATEGGNDESQAGPDLGAQAEG